MTFFLDFCAEVIYFRMRIISYGGEKSLEVIGCDFFYDTVPLTLPVNSLYVSIMSPLCSVSLMVIPVIEDILHKINY